MLFTFVHLYQKFFVIIYSFLHPSTLESVVVKHDGTKRHIKRLSDKKIFFFSFYRRLFGAEGDAMLDKLTTLRPCLVHPKKQKKILRFSVISNLAAYA